MNLAEAIDTKHAAEELKTTPAKLTAFCKEHPSIAPAKFAGRYVWFTADIERVGSAIEMIADGVCLHCGKKAFEYAPPSPKAAPEPADD